MKKESFFKSIGLKLVLLILLGASIFIGWKIYQETSRKNKIQAEINELQREAEKISRENNDFQEKIKYLESVDYKKLEAKDKLNLQSPGENLVVVKPSQSKVYTENNSGAVLGETRERKKEISNWQKWWNYFFK